MILVKYILALFGKEIAVLYTDEKKSKFFIAAILTFLDKRITSQVLTPVQTEGSIFLCLALIITG